MTTRKPTTGEMPIEGVDYEVTATETVEPLTPMQIKIINDTSQAQMLSLAQQELDATDWRSDEPYSDIAGAAEAYQWGDPRPYNTHPFSTRVPAGLIVTQADLDQGGDAVLNAIMAVKAEVARDWEAEQARLAAEPIPVYAQTCEVLGYSPYDVIANYNIATFELHWPENYITDCATCDGGGCGDCIDQGGDW